MQKLPLNVKLLTQLRQIEEDLHVKHGEIQSAHCCCKDIEIVVFTIVTCKIDLG